MPPAVRWSARSAGWLWIFGAALGQCLGYSSQQQRVVLPPSPGQNQQQASYVELKPSQGCSPGYYRENKGLYTGWCVPCNCNGHSNRCQDGSGVCINCQHNTAGEHCERCKEGYYWNTIHGSCRVCPCPHSDSFATGCVVTGENVKCSCKPGYTGTRCERGSPTLQANSLPTEPPGKTFTEAAAAAAAKSLQSCPTLCNPIDGSPPGFPVPGILQARTLEWVAISFSSA